MRKRPTSGSVGWALAALLSVIDLPIHAATPPGTRVDNVASVRYSVGPSSITVASGQVSTLVTGVPGLGVTKTVEPAGTVAPGALVTFRFVIENPAAIAVDNVAILDTLDPLLGTPTAVTTGPVPDKSPSGGTLSIL